MKRIMTFLAVLCLFCCFSAVSTAATEYNVTVKVDGYVVAFPDAKPCIENDRTFVPVRFVAVQLGAVVDWDGNENLVTIKKGDKVITLKVGEKKATVDGTEVALDVASFLRSDRTYVPLRFISETLAATVDWFGESRLVLVNGSDYGEIPVYTRLLQSGEYELVDPQLPYKFGAALKPKDKNYDYWVYVSDDLEKPELDIQLNYSKGYGIVTRQKIKEIIRMCFPNSYQKVYSKLIATMREEIYENQWDVLNHPGVYEDYYDYRCLTIVKEISMHRYTNIDIGVKGYTYTKIPATKDQGPPLHTPNMEQEIQDNQIYYEQ